MKKVVIIAGVAAILNTPFAYAEESTSQLSPAAVGFSLDLLSGPTVEVSYPLNEFLTVRGSLSTGWSFSDDFTDDDSNNNYNFKVQGGINRLSLDVHPFQNGFFLSVGYGLNNLKLKPSTLIEAGSSVDLGDDSYTAETDVSLKGEFNWDNAPAVSFGWGHSPSKGFGFMTEIGMLFTGGTNSSLVGSGTVDVSGESYDLAADELGLVANEEQRIQDEVKDLDVLPIVRLGVSYRF